MGITLAAHTSLGTWPVYAFGSDEQKQEWMPRLTSGETLGAFGLTEPEAGSDAGNVRTRATLEDGEWVIDGAKQFITNSGTDISGFVAITAQHGREGGLQHHRPASGTPGYEIGQAYRKMGWNASDTRPLSFDDCRVPEENLLGPRGMGFKQFMQTLDGGRISVSAMGVGLAQGALDEALAYAKERQAFGQSISKFQAIQAKLADISTEIEAARLLTYKAAQARRTRARTSRSPPRRPSSRPAAWRCGPPRRPCRSTAATATSRSTPCAASTATRRSSPSARAPTRCSRW